MVTVNGRQFVIAMLGVIASGLVGGACAGLLIPALTQVQADNASTVATVLSAVIAMGAFGVACLSWISAKRSSQVTAFMEIAKAMEETAEVRRHVYRHGTHTPLRFYEGPLRIERRDDWLTLLRGFCGAVDNAGFMVQEDIVEEKWVIDMWGRTLAPLWVLVQPQVKEWRAKEGQDELFHHMEWLCRKCCDVFPKEARLADGEREHPAVERFKRAKAWQATHDRARAARSVEQERLAGEHADGTEAASRADE